MAFEIDRTTLIPVQSGHAVRRGWESSPFGQPRGVTLHWAVTPTVKICTKIIGGENAMRKGQASAHYCVGRSLEAGVAEYVSLENRSYHSQAGQTLRWDGKPMGRRLFSGIHTTIGIETAHMGFATDDEIEAGDFIESATPNGAPMDVQLWTDEQMEMLISVGQTIVSRWPDIGVRDWHGHHDIAPLRKIDVTGFPFARLLRGVYDDDSIPDVWTPHLQARGRQKDLIALGHNLGRSGADGLWGKRSRKGLRDFQRAHGMVANGFWSTFTSWAVHDLLLDRGTSTGDIAVAASPA